MTLRAPICTMFGLFRMRKGLFVPRTSTGVSA